MRRWLVVAMAAALAVSACGTRVPEDERAARRAALEEAGGVGAAGAEASASRSAGGEAGAGATYQATAGPTTRSTGSGPSGPAAGSAARGTRAGVPIGGVGPASPAGGGTRGAGPGAGGTSDPGVTDTEIRIGASGPLSGIAAFAGEEALGAIDSFFQTVNANGGVHGRKLRLIAYDDRADSSQTLANVRRLYEVDKVVALYLAFGDSAADYVSRNRIPTLVFGVTHKSFSSRYPTMFPLVGNVLLWTQQWVVALKAKGIFRPGMRVGILYDTQLLPIGPYVPFLKASWENAGAKVVTTDPFNFSDGDCTSLVLKMRQLQVDWWDFQGLGWVLCASAAARQQYRPVVGWGGWATGLAGLANMVGPWIEGMWGASIGDQPDGKPRAKTAAHDEYVNAIRTYHPRQGTFGHLESPAAIGYWMGAKLMVAALQAQSAAVTKAGINDWISRVEGFDPGITPPIGSMAPTCKTGSEVAWFGRWRWDAEKREAFRVPETGYYSSDQKDKFGGKCFLTKISDSFEK